MAVQHTQHAQEAARSTREAAARAAALADLLLAEAGRRGLQVGGEAQTPVRQSAPSAAG